MFRTIESRMFYIFMLIGLLFALPAQAQFYHEYKVTPSGVGPLCTLFGDSVSLSGDLAIIGADGSHDNGQNSGAAFIFQQNAYQDRWTEVKRLCAFDGAADDRFGMYVDIDGEYALVGASLDDDNGSNSGSAYLYGRNQGGPDNWGLVKKLLPSDGAAGDQFGRVSISGDIVAVGAIGDGDLGNYSGSVYIFARDHGGPDNWGEVKKITASDGAEQDYFGKLNLDGDTLVVGASGNDDMGDYSGSAYVFVRDHGGPDNWGEVKKLIPSDSDEKDRFGESVSICGDWLVVGADNDEDHGKSSGSAYIFARDHGGSDNWGEVKKITASDAMADANFGVSASISGDLVVVGADDHPQPYDCCGKAYLFSRNEGGPDNWGEVTPFVHRDPGEDKYFGSCAAVDGDNILIGSHFDKSPEVDGRGAAYFYNQPSGAHLSVYPLKQELHAYIADASLQKSVTVYSVGTQTLTISGIQDPGGEFSLSNLPGFPIVLAPGETLTIDLVYTPKDPGADNATVDFDSDDPNDPLWVYPLLGTGLSFADPSVCYGCTAYPGEGEILTLDLQTGVGTLLGKVSDMYSLYSLAIDSAGRIFSGKYEILMNIDSATGEGYLIGTTEDLYALAFDENDVLYGIDYTDLYTLNTATGVSTLVATLTDPISGMCFDPTDGTLYGSAYNYGSNIDAIYTIDKSTGAQTLVGMTGLGNETSDIAFDSEGNLFGLKDDGSDSFNLISIDKNTGAGTLINATGFKGVKGMDIHRPRLRADIYTLSAAAGGTVNFTLDAGLANADRGYLMLGSMSGCYPGSPLPGKMATLLLNWDQFSGMIINLLNTPTFANFAGNLDGAGMGSAQLYSAPIPGYAGVKMHFAFSLTNPSDYVSNPVMVEIIP